MRVDSIEDLIVLTPIIQADNIIEELKAISSKVATKDVIDATIKSALRGDTIKDICRENNPELNIEIILFLSKLAFKLSEKINNENCNNINNLHIACLQLSVLFCVLAKVAYSENVQNKNLAWTFATDALFWKNVAEKSIEFNEGGIEEVRLRAKNNAKKRLEKDPVQLAKKEIEEEYKVVKSQFQRRGYSAQFIREMHTKYRIIQDQKTIAKLVAKLNKENELIPR